MKVVFVGGRQARTLCEIYRGLSGAKADWIDSGTRFGAADGARLEAADKLALQATGNPVSPDLLALAANAERAIFPELTLDFLWPFGGQPHSANTRDDVFFTGPFPTELGDAWLNRRLAGRERLEAVEAEYLALDVAEIVDLEAYKTLTLQRQAEIDAACGANFASRFEDEFRQRALFANPLAPGPELTRDLANWTFAKLGLPYTLTRDWRPQGRGPEAPLHPSLVRRFGLAWAAGRRCRLLAGEPVDFAEYVRRYLAYAEGPELETGLATLAVGKAEAGLALLEKAAARPMGRRCRSARRALTFGYLAIGGSGEIAATLRRAGALQDETLYPAAEACASGRWAEAEAALLDLLKQRPGAVDLHDALALVRDRRGDATGRIAALRDAVALRPADMHAQSRLTVALANAGDFPGAVASAEAEIALNPENPHARAFLASLLERMGEGERARTHLQRALQIVAEKPEYAGLREELAKRERAAAG